ncbi:HBS1-like protein [Neolecta irregularis DAH-3]|uniref:Elongation factor 1 alpha-like protein n=1 Tax=Neolecta irregularis (strain DAH-3) TaxID=1198029 RepID=A0A1U7LVJ8_NEOID|nr:HBS1-like protein [Neolecta irregularis DAH-3]|eukprot:OLL26649.1 HBS1-like protein [Neolecta irregularis DAH-3]
MSRHRAVRNLDVGDVLAESCEDEHTEMTEEEAEQLENAYSQTCQTLDGTGISEKEIKDALWYYYFDVHKAIDWLLIQQVKKRPNQNNAERNPVSKSRSPDKKASGALRVSSQLEDSINLQQDLAILKPRQLHDEHAGMLLSKERSPHNESPNKKVSKLSALAKSRGTSVNSSTGRVSALSSVAMFGKSKSLTHETSHKEIITPSQGIKNPIVDHRKQKSELGFVSQQPKKRDNRDIPPNPPTQVPELLATASDFATSIILKSFSQTSLGIKADHRFVFPLAPQISKIAFTSSIPKHKRPDPTSPISRVVTRDVRKPPTTGGDTLTGPMKTMGLGNVPVNPVPMRKVLKKNPIDGDTLRALRRDNNVNFVVIGHVDAGKSTMIGRLLHDLGEVEKRTMQKLHQESGKIGKSSFALAWLLDGTEEERNRGVTIDIGIRRFSIRGRTYTLLDAPGHRDFVPNMIAANLFKADFAILVVDGSTGAFESGFHLHGQTKEHALLARSLGVQTLLVAVNKLDNVQWSKERFDTIRIQMNEFLSRVGFDSTNLKFVPCSGLTGGNITTKPVQLSSWPAQKSVLEEIESTNQISRDVDKPFRLSISDLYKGSQSGASINIIGRVASGHIQVGDPVVCPTCDDSAVVKTIEVDDEDRTVAAAGNNVIIGITGFDIAHLRVGDVLCDMCSPIQIVKVIEARIITFDMSRPLTLGGTVVIHRGRTEEPAIISKLISVVDKTTGTIVKKNPRYLSNGMAAFVELTILGKGMQLEIYSINKDFGRIILRNEGETLAAGIVKELLSIHQ